MIGVMAGGVAGGFVASLLGAKAYIMGYSNIIALPIFEDTVLAAVAGVIVAIGVAATVTFILGIEEKSPKKSVTENPPEIKKSFSNSEIVAVTDGEMIPIDQVNDPVFSSKALGDGSAFIPESDFICAPANGKLAVMFETGHAFAVAMNDGTELLVHIGINTVELKGKGFESMAKQGDDVKAGQPIVKIDREFVKSKGYDISTMLIITNDQGKNLTFKDFGKKSSGDILLKIEN